jgi:hypothetical protein
MIQPLDGARAANLLAEATLPAAIAGRVRLMMEVATRAESVWQSAGTSLRGRLVLRVLLDPVLGASPGRGGFAGAAAGHEVDHGEVDHGFGAGGQGFVVAGQAAVEHQPAEGPFYGPAAG